MYFEGSGISAVLAEVTIVTPFMTAAPQHAVGLKVKGRPPLTTVDKWLDTDLMTGPAFLVRNRRLRCN